MTTEKRQRKKEARDRARAAALAARRRQRLTRLIGVLVVLVALIGASLYMGGDDDTADDAADEQTEETPEETPDRDLENVSSLDDVYPGVGPACGGEEPPEASPQEYEATPEMTLQTGVDYRAIVETSCGTIEIDLLPDEAPEAVNNFVFLAREGYFDGLLWHRIEREFVIQTGDPNGLNGTPPDGPGYAFDDELWMKSRDYTYGAVAMANSGPNSQGSQWFIITHDREDQEPAGLPADYTLFGRVDEGSWDVLDAIQVLAVFGEPVGSPVASMPEEPVWINSIEILEG